MNKRMLESKMKLFGDTQMILANAIGISTSRFSAKINKYDGAEFTQSEINAIKDRYKLSAKEVDTIFFTTQVS
ncbi:MAG: XRE family transcriptional regulator [Clostridia bacterium]|nr:XRE family transcriptional regulator [Clostridia bacterium]